MKLLKYESFTDFAKDIPEKVPEREPTKWDNGGTRLSGRTAIRKNSHLNLAREKNRHARGRRQPAYQRRHSQRPNTLDCQRRTAFLQAFPSDVVSVVEAPQTVVAARQKEKGKKKERVLG